VSPATPRSTDKPRAQPRERPVSIPVDGGRLTGTLTLPPSPRGVVLFAHGSGSSRHSPRNQFVADALVAAGLGALLIDLLTPAEEAQDLRTGRLRFDIDLLARRVVAALDWLASQEETAGLPVGVFGASTGAAAALVAAAERPEQVGAVVSRGGRPDLAGEALARVRAPTLLIVGGRDPEVLALNREALHALGPEARLEIVPGATHLFGEPGALARVAQLAARWFTEHLGSR
jgi:dienelactone hydrolase